MISWIEDPGSHPLTEVPGRHGRTDDDRDLHVDRVVLAQQAGDRATRGRSGFQDHSLSVITTPRERRHDGKSIFVMWPKGLIDLRRDSAAERRMPDAGQILSAQAFWPLVEPSGVITNVRSVPDGQLMPLPIAVTL